MTGSPPQELPLAGLKVVELHAIGPVPFAGQLLRSLGARVVRVSPPDDPGLGVRVPAQFDLLNTGKEVRLLGLKDAAGLEALHTELAAADVLIEGFRPGVLERLGLAPATLLERHPRLVMGRLSGWGSRGALAPRAGHDINYLARAGVLAAIGGREKPVVPLNLVADFGGGAMHLLVGVLAKLVQRSITQRGGTVETSILAGTVGLTPMFYGLLAGGVWNLERANNLLDGAMPFYRVYRCADGRFVAVGPLEPKFYRELLDVLGVAGEVDPKDQYRAQTWPATTARFEQRFATRTRDEWAQAAADRDACLSPVLDFAEAARDAHNLANGLYRVEPFAQPGETIRFG
ncbi:MAG TPA: CaiB/BaiF CoA-transferase family protein [Zeimonas sp.]